MSLFHYLRDPGADGVGVAFTSAGLNLSDAQEPAARTAAFGDLIRAIGADVAVVRQVHGSTVLRARRGASAFVDLTNHEADALITDEAGLAVAVRAADCVPVLFADAAAGLVGAAHAGRAGVLRGVVPATVAALREAGAHDLRAWVGPHICGRCYEVPDAMADDYASATGVAPVRTRWGTTGLDLGAGVRAQLDALGVPFESHEACTMTDAALPSYRRDGAAAGRLAGVVWRRHAGGQSDAEGAVG